MDNNGSSDSDSDTWQPPKFQRKPGKAQKFDSSDSEEEFEECASKLEEGERKTDESSSEEEEEIREEAGYDTEPCSDEDARSRNGEKPTVTPQRAGNEGKRNPSLDDGTALFGTSTPLVSGTRKPSRLDITAIQPTTSYFNATIMEENTPTTSLRPTKRPSLGALGPQKSTMTYAAPARDIEEALVADLSSISIQGQKKFTFKHKSTEGRKEEPAGAASLGYYDDEEDEESDEEEEVSYSISPNASAGVVSKDSGNGDSDIRIEGTVNRRKPRGTEVVTLDDADDEVSEVAAKMNRFALGSKTTKGDAPKKSVFLNEPPPLEKETYAYDPTNVRHQEFYGDVQRTVTMMAGVLETMPMPDDEDDDIGLPRGLVKLFDHQKYGLRWLGWRERQFPGGGILADEMGLGKTIMIIALIMKSKHDDKSEDAKNWIDTAEVGKHIPSKTTLVVCPVGCLHQWEEEIKSKGRGLRVYMHHGSNRTSSAAELTQYDVVLTTYQTIVAETKTKMDGRRISPLKKLYWKRIVLDEGHNIRNPKTGSAVSICALQARHRWAVTGTPVHNKPEDFYSMMKFLRMKPFDDPKVWNFWIGMKTVKGSAQKRLDILGKALILRRTKLEVQGLGGNVGKIPPKTVETVEIVLNEEERRVYDYLKQYCKGKFDEFLKNKEMREHELNAAAMTYTAQGRHKKTGQEDAPPEDIKFTLLLTLITRMRQCAVHPHLLRTMLEEEEIDQDDASFDKLNDNHIVSMRNPVLQRSYESMKIIKVLEDVEALRRQAEEEDRPMDKVIIVSSWTSSLDMLHEHLRIRNYSCVSITGRENPTERADNMKKFNSYPKKYHVCLLSLMAGAVGLNLIGGNYVFFLEPYWNPQIELQAQDRVHRFGQKKEVFIRRYISKETIESRILQIQEHKMSLADGVLNSAKRTRGGGLTLIQMRQLFE